MRPVHTLASNGGRGLKLAHGPQAIEAEVHTLASNGGRGLKLEIHGRCTGSDCTRSPAMAGAD